MYLDRTGEQLDGLPGAKGSSRKVERVDHVQRGLNERLSKRYLHVGNKKRKYSIYVPKRYKSKKAMPLVMVLHGCRQTHQDIEAISDFNRLSEKHGFLVVYPFVTHYNDVRTRNCWGWWRPEHIKPGMGEVEDLRCIAIEVCREFAVDEKRIHITGLSSGGGMTVAALTVHPGFFASGAVVAGVPYGERATVVGGAYGSGGNFRKVDTICGLMEKARKEDKTPTPICIIHSHNDETVGIQAAKNIRDSWLQYFGLSKKSGRKVKYKQTKGVPWIHTKYSKFFRKSLVETIFLEGPGHGWYGGFEGDYSYPQAPDISKLIWRFFDKHRIS